MLQLLQIEWLKNKRYATFWVLTGLFALLLPLFNYQFSSGMSEEGKMFNLGYEFPNVWSIFGFWASWFVLFIAFVIIILISNEYRYRTNRQNVIDGWTRMQVFHAKCQLIVFLALLTTLYVGLWCIIFGAAYSNGFDAMTKGMEKLFYFFVLCLNYYGLAAMLAFLLKRSGLAIGIFMLYALIFENILNNYLNWQFKETFIGTYLPLQSSDELLPFETVKQLMSIVRPGSSSQPEAWVYLLVSSAYIVLYYFITKTRLRKSDW
jgi:hypothetical protein